MRKTYWISENILSILMEFWQPNLCLKIVKIYGSKRTADWSSQFRETLKVSPWIQLYWLFIDTNRAKIHSEDRAKLMAKSLYSQPKSKM